MPEHPGAPLASPARATRPSLAVSLPTLDRVRDAAVDAWADPRVRRGTVGTTLVTVGSFTPAFLPPQNPVVDALDLQWLASTPGRVAATVVLVIGMALLVDAWLRMRPHPGGAPLPRLTFAFWSLPLLLAPPLFSRDAYSYAAQGLLVQRGIDPYAVGPAWVGGPFADQVDPMWLYTPAPYGPLALQTQHLVVTLAGNEAYPSAMLMRLPALVSVAVLAVVLPRLAARVGVSREQAMWLGVINPLVLMHFVGGAHGDAMMVALVATALLLAVRGNLVLASITVAAAAGYKQTAALALVGVVGMAAARAVDGGARAPVAVVRAAVAHAAVALTAFTAITLASGLGWGWVPNLTVPASLRSLLAPPTLVGSAVEWLMRVSGMPDAWVEVPLPLVRTVAGLVGLAAIAWITWRLAPRRPVAATAYAFLTLCATSPVIHPWYVLWGGLLLGATRLGPRLAASAVWVTLFLVTYGVVDATLSNGTWALGVTVAGWMLARLRRSQRAHADAHAEAHLPAAEPAPATAA